jgi:hypothetical protein
MRMPRLRTVVGMLAWMMALPLAGCRTAQQSAPADAKTSSERVDAADEARGVAEAALGKQAEILARGDLALNGLEQVLVINRFSPGASAGAGGANPEVIFVTRAAVLEKNSGRWSEVLRCDEYLKNPKGYLGGPPTGRVTGWQLKFSRDANEGLEMKFTPAERFGAADVNAGRRSEQNKVTFYVRWNKSAKRYQLFDQSHERYLSEVPSLETPQSTLR